MPKVKSKSGAKKRFIVMGSGRIKRSKAFHRHHLEHKSGKKGRALRKQVMIHEADLRQVKRMLLV